MVEIRSLATIWRILVSTIIVFCLSSQIGLSAESIPDQVTKPCYPDSLNEVRDFHDEFVLPASNVRSSLNENIEKIDIFGDNGTGLQSKIVGPKIDPKSILGKDHQFKMGLSDPKVTVAVNTEKQTSMVIGDQLESGADGANVMNIEVAHITVIAINTARGGEAIATSEIYVQPTQDMGTTSVAAEG